MPLFHKIFFKVFAAAWFCSIEKMLAYHLDSLSVAVSDFLVPAYKILALERFTVCFN